MGLLQTCCGIAIGVNSTLPDLPASGAEQLISTVTITVNDADDVVRLMATIWSETENSEVTDATLRGNTVLFRIVRTSDNLEIARVKNTDFDEMVTTFIAFDQPGVGVLLSSIRKR